MIKLFAFFLAMVAASTAMSVPVIAAQIADYVAPQPDAPLKILGCRSEVQFSSGAYGTNHANLLTSIDFTNAAPKTAIAVLLRFQMSNAFGDILDTILEQATGQFSSGATIKGNHFQETDKWPGLTIMQCAVNRVLYSDGTDWKEATLKPAPSPSPSTNTQPGREP